MEHCRMCGKQIDGSFGIYCARCDHLNGEAFMDMKAELGI